ncbi:MAG: NAD(P)H-hydrate dehydratase [Bacteroidales bacterium]|nr:NAD(P)H-hydrate dehydratase [Bacteroidales bacterium]
MKILSVEQIRQADQNTIQNEPIASVDLMERAATKVFEWLFPRVHKESRIKVFCGMGNNGGDGLVLARLLYQHDVVPEVFMVCYSEKMSPDCEWNYHRLKEETKVPLYGLHVAEDFPAIQKGEVVVDAIFGSGLNRALSGMTAELINYLNHQQAVRIAIDIASGLFADAPSPKGSIFQADYTLTFQRPKLAFLFPENDPYVGNFEVLDIHLHPQFLDEVTVNNFLVDRKMIKSFLHQRTKYSHKGTYGHALLIAGSDGMVGAAVLSSKACLRTGVGLLSVRAPLSTDALATTLPEAMFYRMSEERERECDHGCFSDFEKLDKFTAIGVGPGLGKARVTEKALQRLIVEAPVPMVMDADALNILSENKTWMSFLHPKTILTPHPKEFERLFGATSTSFERLELQRLMAMKHNIIIVLKGAHTAVAMPNGAVFFNTTGNPGMATAGSGDVLTGMILSLLAQAYTPEEAAVLGVYLHGLAGDIAMESMGQEALLASDIINHIGQAYKRLHE